MLACRLVASSLVLLAILSLSSSCSTASAYSLKGAIKTYGPAARARMRPFFKAAKTAYPPKALTLVALKDEKVLAVFATDAAGKIFHVMQFEILAASGDAGPKLKQGDYQVPEGFYNLVAFNPQSQFHLSLRVDYPNRVDRIHARMDKRTKSLGGDIMIHGNACSAGCLAMGDEGIEDIFTMVYDTGLQNTKLILAPCDLTTKWPSLTKKRNTRWIGDMYLQMRHAMRNLLKESRQNMGKRTVLAGNVKVEKKKKEALE